MTTAIAATPGTITTGAEIRELRTVEYDFVVVGSGPGGSVAAAVLAQAGARVAIIEEGGHFTRRDFNMQEAWAYPNLYQEHGNRATDDLGIIILQGRSVGGGSTVNWTSSFRTPERTLALWAARHGVRGLDAAALAPHFAAVEDAPVDRPRRSRTTSTATTASCGTAPGSWAGTPSSSAAT